MLAQITVFIHSDLWGETYPSDLVTTNHRLKMCSTGERPEREPLSQPNVFMTLCDIKSSLYLKIIGQPMILSLRSPPLTCRESSQSKLYLKGQRTHLTMTYIEEHGLYWWGGGDQGLY